MNFQVNHTRTSNSASSEVTEDTPTKEVSIDSRMNNFSTLLRMLPIILVLSLTLVACAIGSSKPTAGEKIGPPAAETETEETKELFPISYSSAEDNPYVQISQEQNADQEQGTAFMETIGENGLGLISTARNNLYRNNYNIFYAFNDKEGENRDQAIFNLTQAGANNKETYLYATLKDGVACAKSVDPKFDSNGAILNFDANNGIIATLMDSGGKNVCGFELTSQQWKPLDPKGNLVNLNGETIAIPASVNDPNIYNSPVLISDPEIIKIINDKILAGEEMSTSSMTDEQKAAWATDLMNRFLSNGNPIIIQIINKRMLAGEQINTKTMTQEQKNSLSIALAEIRNKEEKTNFITFEYMEEQYFLNPKTMQAEKIPSGASEAFFRENSFPRYMPIQFEQDGTMIVSLNENKINILNAEGFDFRTITNPEDNAIEWPETPLISSGEFTGLTQLQKLLAQNQSSLVPMMIFKSMGLGEVAFPIANAFRGVLVFTGATFETAAQGEPILANTTIVVVDGSMFLFREGDSAQINSTSRFNSNSEFWRTLQEGTIYYLAVAENPQASLQDSMGITETTIKGISFKSGKDGIPAVVSSAILETKK